MALIRKIYNLAGFARRTSPAARGSGRGRCRFMHHAHGNGMGVDGAVYGRGKCYRSNIRIENQ
jgi:hypothetical protein